MEDLAVLGVVMGLASSSLPKPLQSSVLVCKWLMKEEKANLKQIGFQFGCLRRSISLCEAVVHGYPGTSLDVLTL